MSAAFADVLGHLIKRDLVVTGTVTINERMPNYGSQPTAQRPSAAIRGELTLPLTMDDPRPIELFVDRIDYIGRVHLGPGKVPGDALHIGSVLLIELPPGPFVTICAGDRHKQVVSLDLRQKIGHFFLAHLIASRARKFCDR